jgi:hypothetical protein
MSVKPASAPPSPQLSNGRPLQLHSIHSIHKLLCDTVAELCLGEMGSPALSSSRGQSFLSDEFQLAESENSINGDDEDQAFPHPVYANLQKSADEAQAKADERRFAGDHVMADLLQRIQQVWLHLIDCLRGSHNTDTERDVGKIFFTHVCVPVSELCSR